MKNTYPVITDTLPAESRRSNNGGDGNSEHAPYVSRDIFHIIAESTSDLIIHYQYKPINRMAYVSPSFSRITGYTPEEYYADPALPRKCIHPDDQILLNDFLNPEATQGLEPFVFRWIHKDGRIIWLEPTKTIIHDECGEVTDVYYIARDITKRKMTEKKQQAITKTTLDGFWICDLEGRFLDVNDSYCKMTGYTREELLGMSIQDIEAVENPEQTAQRIKKIVEQGSDRFETQHKRKDGKIIDIEISVNYLNIGDGQMCIFVRDITEHKQAEIKTRQSEKRYRLLAENVTDVIWTVDINNPSQLTYISPSVARLLGYSVEEAMTTKMEEIFTPASFETCMKVLAEELSIEKREQNDPFRSRTLDLEFYRKDGTIVPVEIKCSLIREADSRPVEILVVGRDITERKLSEDALRDSQKFNASLLENAPHATVVINPDTSIRYVNPAWERLNGWTQAEVAGMKSPYPWWPEEYLEVFNEGFKEAMKQDTGKGEVIAQKKNGELYWIDMNWASVTNNGELQYLLINSTDITERIKAQEKQQAIIKTALDGFWICNLDGKFLEVNDSYCKIIGYTREELLKMSIQDIEAVESLEQTARRIRKIAEEGYDRFETQHKRKDGRIIDIEISVNYSGIEEGQLFVFVRDITERKRAEEALANEAIRRRILVEQSRDGIVILDENGKVYETNRRFAEMLGYSVEEVLQLQVWDWEYQYPPERVLEMVRTVDENGDHFETRHRRKDGSVYDVEISTNGATFAGQKLIFCVCRDITQRKQAEEDLRVSEEKFRNLFEHAKDAVILADTQTGIIVDVNTAGCRLLGLPKEKIIGMPQSTIHPPETVETGKQLFQDHVEKGVAFTEDIVIQRADGAKVPVDISASVVKLADKSIIQGVFRDITERKQMEKALRESEAMFSSAFRSSPDLMAIVNLKDGKYVKVNDTFSHFIGYTREELIGHSAAEFNLWANPEEEAGMTRLMQEQGKIRHEEYHFRTKTGEIRTWLCSADIISIGGEKHMLAVATDITDRKQAQEALRESEEKFSKAFHSSPGSISISRLGDGKFIEVNEGFLRDKGYTREEIIGRSSKEFEIWANQNEGKRIMKILKEGGHVHNEQMQFRTKEGYVRTGLISAEIISIGNEPCMLVMNNDITQQKLAEERLRLLSSVTQQVSDSTIITDPHFNITYMNQAAQDLLGYSAEEVLGKGLDIFNAEPISREVIQNIFQTVASGKVWSATVPKRRKDGNIIFCESRVSPLYDEKGQVSSFIDVQRDVTEQKEMEVKLQEHKQLIESILAAMPEGVLVIDGNDRIILANKAFYKIFHRSKRATVSKLLGETIHIDQLVNLYEAVKRGEDNDNTLEFRYRVRNLEKIISCAVVKMDGECTLLTFIDISRDREEEEKLYLTDRLASIGEMAAGLAHELNNPLTGILALSQLLVESDISGEYKEDLQSIYGEAKRAASIVKNVLVFARNNTYENGQASVNEVVRDVLRLREHEEKVSNIQVVTNLEDKLPDITIDRYQLQQVFLNIILNAEAAIKDTNRPGILTVTTERANDHVNIMFKDNGCGIKKHIMPRIFDPFFTTKEIGKGTGLGLSICYSIVVKHGGKISVRSQVNKGSTFTIKVPVVT